MKAMWPFCARNRLAAHGFIVVAVLWILGALATLATIYAVYVVDTATALAVHDERVQAEALVTAGLELTAYKITAIPESRPSRGRFAFRAGNANVAVDFRSETARIDLNSAPKALLAGLFTALGARRDAAEVHADRVIAWREGPKADNLDNETAAYRTAGLQYGPRLAPFPHTGELSLVLGLPEALVERALPFVTVYSGQPQINLFDAAPEVLAALPGMTPDRLHGVLAQRELVTQNAQAQDMIAALGPVQGLVTSAASKATRVIVRVNFENGRRMSSEVVILLRDSGDEPYSVLSWRDAHDEVPDDLPRAGTR